jgi:transaldolase
MKPSRDSLKVKLFADGADLNGMIEMASKSHIAGLTTNPTLMRKSGVTDYVKFAKEVIKEIPNKPISFEVFSDDLNEMVRQAIEISRWGENVYVKIPISNTVGHSTAPVIQNLVREGIKVNITALMTIEQVYEVVELLDSSLPSYISIFAGRIADTGRNPIEIMVQALEVMNGIKSAELIWASPRELLNVFQANEIGCHVITATNDILKKLELVGHDLTQYSLETVRMFHEDALASNFKI